MIHPPGWPYCQCDKIRVMLTRTTEDGCWEVTEGVCRGLDVPLSEDLCVSFCNGRWTTHPLPLGPLCHLSSLYVSFSIFLSKRGVGVDLDPEKTIPSPFLCVNCKSPPLSGLQFSEVPQLNLTGRDKKASLIFQAVLCVGQIHTHSRR